MQMKTLLLTTAIGSQLIGCGGSDGPQPVANTERATAMSAPPVADNPLAAFMAASPALAGEPMDAIVSGKILPQLDYFFDLLVAHGLEAEVDGVKVFAPTSGDKFLPGKVAIGLSYLLLNKPQTDPKFPAYLIGYRQIADATLDTVNETWGIYYYTSALWKLKKAGLLEQAISPDTLTALQTKLDYRTFVRPDYSLINLPTNYYGVAFSIARLRYLLGWEGPEASEALLQKMINHYKTFSAFGFSDETDGSGRFDRYSILLIGEIMQRLIETGMQPSAADMALLRGWLRQSVDVIKLGLNPAGNGIDYGRSLSAYADTAFAEVLSAAAHLDVLTREEKQIAYAFATRITAKYVEFWYDADMKSVNLWEKGRRTDSYRHKGRILGENLSLSHQLIYTNNLWKADGYADKAPMAAEAFFGQLHGLPRATLTKFAGFNGQPTTYDRALVTYRDDMRIFSLPLVNGAKTYHRTNPYFAVPFSYNLLSGVADTQWPQLQPRFTMADGQPLIPASFIKNVQTEERSKTLTVRYVQDGLDRASGSDPVKDERLTSATEYVFEPGRITRIDTYTPNGPQAIKKIEMEFGTYSGAVTQSGNRFSFASGDVTGFEVEGLETCAASDVSTSVDYQTPTGAFKTSVKCSFAAATLSAPLVIKWVLRYRSPGVASIMPR